jgi:hypothetical protein
MHPFAIRADPGRTITHAPFIFFKTLRADLKTAGAVPAKGFFLFTAVAAKFLAAPPPWLGLFVLHQFSPKPL